MSKLLASAPAGSEQPLTFTRTGTGTLFYSARLRYAVDQLFQQGSDQGIRIARAYAPYVETGTRPAATTFKAGDLVRVTLTLNLTKERRFVAVTDPLPAGFEPVESWFATSAAALAQRAGSRRRRGGGWFDWWQRGGFDHVERHDDRVQLFATRLSEGRHTFTYVVRATTAGIVPHGAGARGRDVRARGVRTNGDGGDRDQEVGTVRESLTGAQGCSRLRLRRRCVERSTDADGAEGASSRAGDGVRRDGRRSASGSAARRSRRGCSTGIDTPSTVVVDRHGRVLYEALSQDGSRIRPLDAASLPPVLEAATLAAEDRRFYSHPGVDPISLVRAAKHNLVEGRVVEGGSTITQQVAKLLIQRREGVRHARRLDEGPRDGAGAAPRAPVHQARGARDVPEPGGLRQPDRRRRPREPVVLRRRRRRC